MEQKPTAGLSTTGNGRSSTLTASSSQRSRVTQNSPGHSGASLSRMAALSLNRRMASESALFDVWPRIQARAFSELV